MPYLFLFLLLLSACCSAPDECYIAPLVESRIGKSIDLCEEATLELLASPLTIDSAVQLALLHNPQVKAHLAEVGLAQAELIEAGLLRNPFVEGFVRYPDQHSFHLNVGFSLLQNVIDLLLIPMRKQVAEAEVARVHARVAFAILDLAYQVQTAFIRFQAEVQRQQTLAELDQLAEAVYQLAKAQQESGNIGLLEASRQRQGALEAKIAVAESKTVLIKQREELKRLLGLTTEGWQIEMSLAAIPEQEMLLADLNEQALGMRLDMEEVRWELERIARLMGTKHWWAYTNLAAGFSTEREPEGVRVTGPAFAATVPLFNRGQADRTRLEALYRKNFAQLQAMEIAVLSEVREAYDQLLVQRQVVEIFQNELLPYQEELQQLSMQYYNAMALGSFELLRNKELQLQGQLMSQMALRDYWLAKIALERALGGHL